MLEDGNKQCFFTTISELRSVVSCVCCIAVSVQSRSVNLKRSLVAVVVVVTHPADTSHNHLSPCSLFYPRSSRFPFATSSTRESVHRLIALKNVEKRAEEQFLNKNEDYLRFPTSTTFNKV